GISEVKSGVNVYEVKQRDNLSFSILNLFQFSSKRKSGNELELRQTIQSATNKSEQFNEFVKWLFFGGEGIIAENMRHQQRKIIKYNHLVANMVILHNADTMTRALQALSEDGFQITPGLLEQLSSYWRGHINRFGDYRVNLLQSVRPLHYSLGLFN
ncbi:MAG: Tn3 family transposase, partial [Candidatus Thiodiazotropha endolucinida]